MRGGAWRHPGRPGRRGGEADRQEVAGRVAACTERVPLSSWHEEGDDWHGQLAGPAYWAAGPGQVAQGMQVSSLFPICFFLFSNICFDLIKILNHFVKS